LLPQTLGGEVINFQKEASIGPFGHLEARLVIRNIVELELRDQADFGIAFDLENVFRVGGVIFGFPLWIVNAEAVYLASHTFSVGRRRESGDDGDSTAGATSFLYVPASELDRALPSDSPGPRSEAEFPFPPPRASLAPMQRPDAIVIAYTGAAAHRLFVCLRTPTTCDLISTLTGANARSELARLGLDPASLFGAPSPESRASLVSHLRRTFVIHGNDVDMPFHWIIFQDGTIAQGRAFFDQPEPVNGAEAYCVSGILHELHGCSHAHFFFFFFFFFFCIFLKKYLLHPPRYLS
jgi:hypothetical protein